MDAVEVLAQLRADPGLREMARALLLGDELLRLPGLVAELAKGQLALEQAVVQLVTSHKELRADVDKLRAGQDELRAGQDELRVSVEALQAGQEELRASVEALRVGQEELRVSHGELRVSVEALQAGQEELRASVKALQAGHGELRASVDALQIGQDELRKAVGSLSNTVGGTAEEDAIDVLSYVARQRGYTLLGEPMARDLDGDGELDAWAPARAPDGSLVSILVEAKVRLRAREVRAFAARLSDPAFRSALAEAGIGGPYVVYAFGIRIYPEARDAARAAGIGVLSGRGEEVAPGPLAA